MRIGIIGIGNIGGTLARLLVDAGHEVVVANSRGPETVAGLVAELGERAAGATAAGAAEAGAVVIIAIPFTRYRELPAASLAGRIVVDANNDWSGAGGGDVSSSEVIAASLPGAVVVKAFNTIHFVHLRDQGLPVGMPGRRAIPIAGDDPAAKATVAALIDEIGFDVYDAGPLAAGRRIEPGSPAFNVGLTRDEIAAALA